MQALILAGGEGTRLRPLTLTTPKPALQLVDRPFLRFMIDWLASHGVDDVVVASGFGADELRAALGDGRSDGASVAYITEDEPLGTGGPVRLAADHGILSDRFLVLNGDVLTDLDLGDLIRAHESSDAVATLALYPVDDPTAYGLVRRTGGPKRPGEAPEAPTGEVLEFLEKPDADAIDTDEISAGAYVLERQVVDLIPAGRKVSIEREVFPRLVGSGLYGHGLKGYWMDIGTPERYLQASWDILEGRVKSDVSVHREGVLVEADAAVATDASIGPRAVIARGTQVRERASVLGSVVLPNGRVGAGATVTESILAPDVRIGEGARVGPGAVLGEGCEVEAGAELGAGTRIGPRERAA